MRGRYFDVKPRELLEMTTFIVFPGNYDARIRVILHDWATKLFGLSIEHFEMLEDAIVLRVEHGNVRQKSPQ
jgi:hypothetical protein